MLPVTQIQSPRGIRFDCSGCSNCCLEWPVPLSDEDYERISSLPLSFSAKASTRLLKSSRSNLLAFSHTLEKGADGSCDFLMQDKRCRLHCELGVQCKPCMCRLFPYSFTVTPDVVLASVSFASSAVLHNSGRLLAEQSETLSAQYQLFRKLFETHPESWRKLQIIDGQTLDWEKFREIDAQLGFIVEGDSQDPSLVPSDMGKKLVQASERIVRELPDAGAAEREPRMESRPKIVDQILLKHLDYLYFPCQVFAEGRYDLDAREFLRELIAAPQAVSFGRKGSEAKFSELIGIKLGKLSQEIDDLLNRFLYVRFFSKLFFGPGFHHLSLLAGIHHLRILSVLLRLKIKQALASDPKSCVSFEFVCELVRTLDRRLSQLDFSPQSLAMLEVLLASPLRQERLPFLAE